MDQPPPIYCQTQEIQFCTSPEVIGVFDPVQYLDIVVGLYSEAPLLEKLAHVDLETLHDIEAKSHHFIQTGEIDTSFFLFLSSYVHDMSRVTDSFVIYIDVARGPGIIETLSIPVSAPATSKESNHHTPEDALNHLLQLISSQPSITSIHAVGDTVRYSVGTLNDFTWNDIFIDHTRFVARRKIQPDGSVRGEITIEVVTVDPRSDEHQRVHKRPLRPMLVHGPTKNGVRSYQPQRHQKSQAFFRIYQKHTNTVTDWSIRSYLYSSDRITLQVRV